MLAVSEIRGVPGVWALPVGEAAGQKTSTGFCPPEAFTEDPDTGRVVVRAPGGEEQATAAPTWDIWGFGVLAFRALATFPLFHTDNADNISSESELLHDPSSQGSECLHYHGRAHT